MTQVRENRTAIPPIATDITLKSVEIRYYRPSARCDRLTLMTIALRKKFWLVYVISTFYRVLNQEITFLNNKRPTGFLITPRFCVIVSCSSNNARDKIISIDKFSSIYDNI